MPIVAVLTGCLSVFCLSLVLLLFIFQAPLWHSYSSLVEQLHTDIWQYLLADKAQMLISHPQLDANEERHLLDVKRLLWSLFALTPLLLLIFGISSYWAKTRWQQVCSGIALLGFASVVVVLLFVALGGFRSGFVRFHELLFASGSWWFLPDSGLIQAFPISYFQQFAVFFALLVSAIFAMLYGISYLQGKSSSISSSSDTPS